MQVQQWHKRSDTARINKRPPTRADAMRIIMLALFARGARALSAVPAAARRLQKIKELESKHALLVESGAKPAVIRNARKELGRLKRTPPPVDNVRVGRGDVLRLLCSGGAVCALSQRLRQALEEDGLVLGSVSVASEGYNGALAVPVERRTQLAQTLSQAAPELWPTEAGRDQSAELGRPADAEQPLPPATRERKEASFGGWV